ncbi:LamG domain-containing protein [Ancylomarina longa]|uniref:LamG domain-containing protein n=1 Tax=Ancylomarina longa TaxID=2487017 RepID=A0A434AX33_9BACT|nr:LamG domain-containing protein [Ancylomarina longa]RUT79095.1 LamG domain-containing protein [Ancylomarina longa]
MKALKLNIKLLSFLAAFVMVFAFAACNDDNNNNTGGYETGSLDALITEAEGLIANSVEGINAGDFKPGSKDELQEVVNWVYWRIDNAKNQEEIADAVVKLQRYIDIFKANIVAVAMPYIQQENDTYIQISDNIKPVLNGAFTIEIDCYIVDLNTKGYSNNLFSCEQSGPDSGFGVRYFSDGKIQVVVGNNNWVDSGDQAGAGTMKSGEWMHVALTNTGSHQILYVNGAAVATNDNTHLLAVDKSFVIGNSPMWTDRVCNMLVREFRVWNSVLDPAAIQANISAGFTGSEAGLECYFPFGSDLGSDFSDVTGNYKASIKGKIDWVNEPPVIVLDKSKLEGAIQDLTDFKATIVEGNQDGDYPIGTLAYIDELISNANDKLANETRQSSLDDAAESLLAKIDIINSMLVEATDGIFIDHDNPDAVGLRITPNYTPQGDYTVEFNVKVKSLFGYGTGEFFNNGNYGIWVYGYDELTEENVLGSGGLWNFTNAGNGWEGPKADALTMKTGEWQHVAIVHDDTARTTTLYVDGEEKGVQTDVGAPEVSGWGEMWLGNGWGKMDGYMKDFRLWDVARDAADLDAAIDGTEAGLNVYFPLDKVAGVKFEDVTGNYKGEMRGISWNVE